MIYFWGKNRIFCCRAWQDEALKRISTMLGLSSLLGVILLARHQPCSQAAAEIFSKFNMENLEKLFKF